MKIVSQLLILSLELRLMQLIILNAKNGRLVFCTLARYQICLVRTKVDIFSLVDIKILYNLK